MTAGLLRLLLPLGAVVVTATVAVGNPSTLLAALAERAETELRGNILPFWLEHVPHPERDGFYGEVVRAGEPRSQAPRAALLSSRILWTFSAAYRHYGEPAYLTMADRAYRDLVDNFRDARHGGYFWSIHADGSPRDLFKHVYGQSFVVYAMSEYYRATGEPSARVAALELFALIEARAADQGRGGYWENFTRDWEPVPAHQPSAIGPPAARSQNTHLHLMEAYTNLWLATGDLRVREALRSLVGLMLERILDPETGHLGLYFDEDWRPISNRVSYGHDIEFAWLATEAAQAVGDAALREQVRVWAVRIAGNTLARGVEKDGGIPYEVGPKGEGAQLHREWWVPAEAAVGFLNAYQLSHDSRFLEAADAQWQFIERHFVDREGGEWFHSVSPSGERIPRAQVSGWKGPYHNGRACLELLVRARGLLGP
jgi:cellobiose epimerase